MRRCRHRSPLKSLLTSVGYLLQPPSARGAAYFTLPEDGF